MNANTRRERNADESDDDELATVYERPTSEQAKDRLNSADSATINGWDVTLDDEDELKNDDQHESDSDSLDLDEDELERAKEDVAYVDALLNGEDPEADDEDNEDNEDDESDYEHGDEVVVNDMPDWQHPFTVSVVYHSGALKVTDKDGAWYRVSEDEVDDVVSPVNDGKELVTDGGVDTLASIESERTRDDYVDLQDRYDQEVDRPDNCECDIKNMVRACEACQDEGFERPYCDHDWRPASHWDIDEMCVICGLTRENDEVDF